jgi:CubicO group peptidase (beta-lactamase class C family)
MPVDAARDVIAAAIRARVFPAAAVEVGSASAVLWNEAFGTRTFDDATRVTSSTLFDLASLTKPVATTTVALALADRAALALDDPVARYFEEWRGEDREAATIRDLLEHASGLPARLVDPPPSTRREFEHDICGIKLEYDVRTRSIYSDLGFILLGFLLADVSGEPLDRAFARAWPDPLLAFQPGTDLAARAAPTQPMDEDVRRGRLLTGEVHDNYAAALGGVAGHAGLFGTAAATGRFARMLLQIAAERRGGRVDPSTRERQPFSRARYEEMIVPSTVPGSSRGLGWDTMLPTSSCGAHMSAQAFGHVGFTGTSLWIDPARDRYFVLLANRVCGGGTIGDMRTVRRAFHDALRDV